MKNEYKNIKIRKYQQKKTRQICWSHMSPGLKVNNNNMDTLAAFSTNYYVRLSNSSYAATFWDPVSWMFCRKEAFPRQTWHFGGTYVNTTLVQCKCGRGWVREGLDTLCIKSSKTDCCEGQSNAIKSLTTIYIDVYNVRHQSLHPLVGPRSHIVNQECR